MIGSVDSGVDPAWSPVMLSKLRDRAVSNNGHDTTDADLSGEVPVGDETLHFHHGAVPLEEKGAKWTALPRRRGKDEATDSERKAKLIVYGMLSAVPISVLAVLLAIAGLAVGGGSASTTASAGSDDETGSRFEAAAAIVAADYLAGRDTIIPASFDGAGSFAEARNPDPGGSGDQAPPPIEYDQLLHLGYDSYTVEDGREVEVHTFVVQTGGGSILELTVPIIDNNGATLAGWPSLMPATVGDAGTINGLDWGGLYSDVQVTDRNIEQINAWAQAWAADDSTALYAISGDTQANIYTGLGGYAVNETKVADAALRSAEDSDDTWLIATVTIDMSATADPRVRLTVSYDVLLTNLENAQANVSAWGPKGSAYKLVPFQNATPEDPEVTTTTPGS